MMRTLYRILSALVGIRAASRGPAPFARYVVRRTAHRSVARGMRGIGL